VRPTVAAIRAGVGIVYGPTGPGEVSRHRGGGGLGWGGDEAFLGRLKVPFQVGSRPNAVTVTTSCYDEDADPRMNAFFVLAVSRRPRFPLTVTITRTRVDIPVDGTARPFTVYACGRRARAVGTVDDRILTVEGAPGRIRALRLGALDPDALPVFLEPEASLPGLDDRPSAAPRMHMPSAKAVLAELNGAVVGLRGSGARRKRRGFARRRSGYATADVVLSFVIGARTEVDVQTSSRPVFDTSSFAVSNAASQVLHRGVASARLAFPLELRVARERIRIDVGGRGTPFVLYSCGSHGLARGAFDGNDVTIAGPVRRLRRLALFALTAEELAAHLRRD
jgi:hypothetical protein